MRILKLTHSYSKLIEVQALESAKSAHSVRNWTRILPAIIHFVIDSAHKKAFQQFKVAERPSSLG